MRDLFKYSNAWLIIPPVLVPVLRLFNGTHTDTDLKAELQRLTRTEDVSNLAQHLMEQISKAGFFDDANYAKIREEKHRAFEKSSVRQALHVGTGYPKDVEELRGVFQKIMAGDFTPQPGVLGIAAPHVSINGGWQSYRSAYHSLSMDLASRTFVILGTSHFGPVNRFGLTRKPFSTPWGTTTIAKSLIDELADQPAVIMEDYCHTLEHSIEFQVLYLQAIYGASVRILPILCGPLVKSAGKGDYPEGDEAVGRFFDGLRKIAVREKQRLFWVLGVDMAHVGVRYHDKFVARAGQDNMVQVEERDKKRIEKINAADAHGFWDLVQQQNGDDLKWCGSSPFYTFLKAVPQTRGSLQRYEQWNIDRESVVSFAGISFAS